jgi:hypothetical protein
MLIGKKCEFIGGESISIGIIVDKYRGNNYEYYIIDTGSNLKHIPCANLTKIYTDTSNSNNENGYINPSKSHPF